MASGSFFVVLRERPDKQLTRKDINSKLGSIKKLSERPQLVHLDKYTYADTKKRIALDALAAFEFCSPLNTLAKEHFGLNPYSDVPGADRTELDYTSVHKIWQALQYILTEEYSKTTEDMLDNCYINVFSNMSSRYLAWKYRWNGGTDEDLEDSILYRLRDAVKCMLTLMQEADTAEKIRVLYIAW